MWENKKLSGLVSDRRPDPKKISNLFTFQNDYYDFLTIKDTLREAGLLKKFKNCLDIGGEQGVQAALIRMNLCDNCDVSDIVDWSNIKHSKIWTELLKRGVKAFLNSFGIMKNKTDFWRNTYTYTPSTNFFFPKRTPRVRRFYIGGFNETTFEHDYDLIVSFRAINLIELNGMFKKVDELTEKGAVFCFIVRNMMGPGQVHLTGDMPFFDKQLSKEEIITYYKEKKPHLLEQAQEALELYKYETTDSICQTAIDYGFALRNFKILMPADTETVDLNEAMDKLSREGINIMELKEKIQSKFQGKNCNIIDLIPTYQVFCFTKD